ncbi:hypothetical protein [Rhodopseudomonas palustris]|uniref:Uncharacterized protein n=1 Tax=Rhodopseudomonas palustris (strain BisB18) TaxID=316056 RepID=Q21AN3_RHOPB
MRDDPAAPERWFATLRQPLFRLLAINLAGGAVVAALLTGGLLLLNPGRLRELIFADASPGTALGLLLFGFVVTFGSAAMGTAVMAMGQDVEDKDGRGGGHRKPTLGLPVPVRAAAPANTERRR